MSWIDDHKGAGPWSFVPQSDKPHYNEGNLISDHDNPVWEMDFLDTPVNSDNRITPVHYPWCGYWTKDYVPPSIPPASSYGLRSTGENDHGALALGDIGVDRNEFTLVSETGWTMIECGGLFVGAIKDDGTLWGAGQNTYGQLGLDDITDRSELTQISTDTWIWVTCLNHSMIAIKSDGTLWATGYNNNGELGLNDSVQRQILTQVGSASDWKSLSGGNHYTIAVKNDGSLYGTGMNYDGELGLGDQVARDEFTFISSENWVQVFCGAYHTLAIKDDGTLWVCGVANSGQLGLGPAAVTAQRKLILTQVGSDSDWTYVAGGQYHSCAVKGGTLYGTGQNYYGELGLGNNDLKDVFTLAGGDYEKVFAGNSSSYALKSDGTLYTVGHNYNGQLGLGDNTDRNLYTLVSGITCDNIAVGGYNFTFAATI